jgi:hypothetical protein
VRAAWPGIRGGVIGLAAVILLAVAAPSAGAAAALPVGETDGVRIVRERGALVVVFTPRAEKLRRRVAGKLVSVLCTEFTSFGTNGGGITQRAPRRGRRIYTGDLTRGMDYCRVWLAARTVRRDGRRTRIGREHLVSVPLTQVGAVYLDEQFKAFSLLSVLTLAGLLAEERKPSGYPTPAQLLEAVPGFRPRPSGQRLVALAAPSDTPPGTAIGYYSDGAQHVAAVIVSASGRRLFVEYDGDVLHTNVAGFIYGDLD